MLKIEGQLAVDTLQFFLLVGRLPPDIARDFIGQTGEPRHLSMLACMAFVGLGVHWPMPCLARQMDGGWFNIAGAGPGDGTEWSQ